MKRILSLIIAAVMIAGAVPFAVSAERAFPFELTAPTDVVIESAYGGDSTLMWVTFTQPEGVRQFIADKHAADEAGTFGEFLDAMGYDEVNVYAQYDWALDDPTDWKYDEELWMHGPNGYGYDNGEEFEYRLGFWEAVDREIDTDEETVGDNFLCDWSYDYAEWCEDEAWVGTEFRPGLKDQLPEGSYTVDETGLHIDWSEHTLYVRVRYTVIGWWHDDETEEYGHDELFGDWSETAAFGADGSSVERHLPFELTAPSGASLAWMNGGDSPTTLSFSYARSTDVLDFVVAYDRAVAAGTVEEFMADCGYSDIFINEQFDWAIDDPTDWKYNNCPEAWDGEYGLGYNSEGEMAIDEWSCMDYGWGSDFTAATNTVWVLRGTWGDYSEWCDDLWWAGDGAQPGIRDLLKPGQYVADEDGLRIDWKEHTAYGRIRYAVQCQYWVGDTLRVDWYYSDWSEPAAYGKDAVKWEPPTQEDFPAPVISDFRMTEEEFNGWPVIAYTLDVPDELVETIAKIESYRGSVYIVTECRELGTDGEWVSLQGDGTVRSGENEWDLVSLAGYVEMTEYTSLELRAKYVVYIYINEPDREVEYGFESPYSDILTFKGKDIPVVHDHVWGEDIVDTDPTCTATGTGHHFCEVCGEREDIVIDALGHAWGEPTVTVQPTCTEKGKQVRICTRCEAESDPEDVSPLGHEWGEYTVTTAPTCTNTGIETAKCVRCDATSERSVASLGHKWGDWFAHVEPTCTEKGVAMRICPVCEEYETREIEAKGHSYVETVIAPVCESIGYTRHTCSVCGDFYDDGIKQPLGHIWDEGVVTKEPTKTEEGVLTHTCERCGKTYDERITKLLSNAAEVFDDVNTNDWFAQYVDYVYSYDLMQGTSKNLFNPNGVMNRAMIVTVLWRVEGKPTPKKAAPFNDLTEDWYRDAVAWAYENDIVKGVSADRFSPSAQLTREAIATIIYRYSKYRGMDVSAETDISNYPDYESVSSWAVKEMRWAVAEGLITGSREGGTVLLLPQNSATRAQLAAILMRYLER